MQKEGEVNLTSTMSPEICSDLPIGTQVQSSLNSLLVEWLIKRKKVKG